MYIQLHNFDYFHPVLPVDRYIYSKGGSATKPVQVHQTAFGSVWFTSVLIDMLMKYRCHRPWGPLRSHDQTLAMEDPGGFSSYPLVT
jgi:hypothetical protein